MCAASLFSHLLLDRQKDEYFCSFLEAVPRLAFRHMLQPIVRLLLRLAVVTVVFWHCWCSSSSSFSKSSTSLALAPDSEFGVRNQNFTDGFLLEFDFSRLLLKAYNGLFYLYSSVWPRTVAETQCHEGVSFFYSDSKTDLKLLRDYCIKLPLFEGAQNILSRFTAVCCMLLPHNPYRVPQH